MQHTSSWAVDSFSESQEIAQILSNLQVHYCVYKILLLWQMNPVHTPPSYFFTTNFNINSHLCLHIPSDLLPSGFPTKTMYTCLYSPTLATCPAHQILLHLMIILFGQEYKLWRSSLLNFPHSPITSSPLCLNSFLSSL